MDSTTNATLELLYAEVNGIRTEMRKLMAEVKNENAERLYTKMETAQILKVSTRTLNNYMRDRKISPTYHDRAVRFTQKEIARYINENTIH